MTRTCAPGITALAVTLAAALGAAPPAGATVLPQRTAGMSVDAAGVPGNDASRAPAISELGTVAAFETAATTLGIGAANDAILDVVLVRLSDGARTLVSDPGGGLTADGPSSAPALNRDGSVVAFVSSATNLVAADANGVADVFVRSADGTIARVSTGPLGAEANGPSSAPDVSADGRFVVFSSTASNLVAGDVNGAEDVFVHDRRDGTTRLVSATPGGAPGNGRSSTPAISADGAVVSFESLASDLVARDTNRVADVFARNVFAGRTARVSVSSRGRQQDRAVGEAFRMQSDVSRDGRYVVFDSDATNLTALDRNGSTDVFVRDRRARATRLVSASSVNVQGNNDSFAPSITPDGRHLMFRTFATNMVRGDASGEDLVVRDLRSRTTTTVDVTSSGDRRIPAPLPAAGRRGALSGDAAIAVFSSASPNVVAGDRNRVDDVFLRRLDPAETSLAAPRARGSRTVRLRADDAAADRFVCRLDRGAAFPCGPRVTVPGTSSVLEARAGGPGVLFDPTPLRVRLGRAESVRPTVRIRVPRGTRLRTVRGTASDASGIRRVEVSVAYLVAGGCEHLARSGGRLRLVKAACTRKIFVPATGGRSWSVRLPRSVRGAFRIIARATDNAGNRGRSVEIRVVVA